MAEYLERDAHIDGKYRYRLSRRVAKGDQTVLFVGLNPSTANAEQDDHTIRRCVGSARAWKYHQLRVVNLNAWRDTHPRNLPKDGVCAVGPRNRETLERLVKDAKVVIAAWGSHRLSPEAGAIATWLLSLKKTHVLGLNRDGTPKHPRNVPKTVSPVKPSGPVGRIARRTWPPDDAGVQIGLRDRGSLRWVEDATIKREWTTS